MRLTRLQADILLLLVALIWGSAFVAQHWGMASLGPLAFTGVRFLIGAMVVLPLAWMERSRLRQEGRRLDGRQHGLIAALGLLLGAGAVLQQIGIISTSVTNAGFLTALYVPLVPLCAWLLLRERPHPMVWPCALACLGGTWLLSGAGQVSLNTGDLWVLASTLPWTLHVLWVGRVAEKLAAPFTVACGQFLACGVGALALGLVYEPLSWQQLSEGWEALAYTGLVSVGIGFTGQMLGQRYTRSADAAILLSTESLFAALFGAWFMGDRLGLLGWAGASLMMVSIVVVQCLPQPRPATTSPRCRPGEEGLQP